MLHFVTQREVTLDCLLHALPNDPIVLMQSAVFSAVKSGPHAQALIERLQENPVYALSIDVAARGLVDRLLENVIVINDSEWVALTQVHTSVQTWA